MHYHRLYSVIIVSIVIRVMFVYIRRAVMNRATAVTIT